MFDAFDLHMLAPDGLEYRQRGGAQTGAGFCCNANRAVILDEQKGSVGLRYDGGHRVFFRAYCRQCFQATGQ